MDQFQHPVAGGTAVCCLFLTCPLLSGRQTFFRFRRFLRLSLWPPFRFFRRIFPLRTDQERAFRIIRELSLHLQFRDGHLRMQGKICLKRIRFPNQFRNFFRLFPAELFQFQVKFCLLFLIFFFLHKEILHRDIFHIDRSFCAPGCHQDPVQIGGRRAQHGKRQCSH